MKKRFKGLLVVLLLITTFTPFIKVNAEGTSRVQVIMSEFSNNNHGTFTISGGGLDSSVNHNSSISPMIEIGTQLTLTATPDEWHNFVGWYNCEEYDTSGSANLGNMGWRPIEGQAALSSNASYTFTVQNSYYNIMPVFDSKVGHNNIWMTGNGKIAVYYENRIPSEQPLLDGEHWESNGIVVDYTKGDEITLKAKADTGNHFVGWFITDRAASVPANYVREPVISTSTTYTYTPGVTTVTVNGEPEVLNYITAVFAPNSTSLPRRTVVIEYIARPYKSEEVPYDTDLATYTASKMWGSTDERWIGLFGCVDGVWQYPAQTGETWTFVEQEVTDTEIINKYTLTYDQMIVTKAAAPRYSITDGNNQTFILGNTNDILITANGDLSKLTEIKVNNKTLDSSNYELVSGSTKLTLKNSYLNTLSAGEYTIKFLYNDGSVDATLTIVNPSNNPNTSDSLLINIIMIMLSLFVFISTIFIYRKIKN